MSSLDDLLSELSGPTPTKPPPRTNTASKQVATDDLDSLLSDLAAPAPSANTPKRTPASKPIVNDDLDSLLSDLAAPVPKATASPASKKVASPAPAPAKSAPLDDIDSLLSDLAPPPASGKIATAQAVPAVKKAAASPPLASSPTNASPAKRPAASSDLDDLLSDLSAPAPKKVASPAPKKTSTASNDLDALLGDLGAPPAKVTAKVNSQPKVSTAKPVAAAAKPVDDLDALMADLGPAPPKPVAAKSVASPAKLSSKNDDLDALMADLGPALPKPVAAKPVASPAKLPSKNDDLDALMADLGPAPPKSVAAKPVASPAKPPSKNDDLDALMADLGPRPPSGYNNTRPPVPSVNNFALAPTAKPSSKADDLDAMMADLGGSRPAVAPFKLNNSNPPSSTKTNDLDSLMADLNAGSSGSRNKPSGAGAQKRTDDLDSLMNSLSSPSVPSGTAPRPALQPARPAAGSGSRFDDLLSSVNADMNDLNSPSAVRSKGVCFHCRQPIYEDCMQALGRTYHPEHFMCGSCNNPLGTGSFFELAGTPHCQRCYSIQYCPKCAHCAQPITDRCVTALDKKWHTHCFVCTQCTAPFTANFFERDGRPYCDRCFHQVFAPRCRSCNEPVLGDCVNALGAQWHPEHFNCQFCRRAFTGTFFEYEGMPYCEQHYYQKMGSTCSGCQQPITGACVDALGKKWHPDHFTCAFCMNKLEGTSYSEKNSKPYCRPCFGKLFGA